MVTGGSPADTQDLNARGVRPHLFSPLTLRGLTLRNRIVVSPMCQYKAHNGLANDWHLVHLGRFAMGGAGMVLTEATAVEARGRITHGDLGLWSDDQVKPLRRITTFLRENGAMPTIQLAHAGRKACVQRPWFGNGPLGEADRVRGDLPWDVVSASALPVDAQWLRPLELDQGQIDDLLIAWQMAARRAVDANFAAIELHCAHGYLLHQFLSPLSNQRQDAYGGSLENRMRFPLDVVQAVRAVIPSDMPLFLRVSAIDGVAGGWTLADTLVFAAQLRNLGVDVVDCSSGGMLGSPTANPLSRQRGFQVPFAQAVRQTVGVSTMAVGLILDPQQAQQVLLDGCADLIALGREFLSDPNWGVHAALELLGRDGYREWPENAAWWLSRRSVSATP